MKKFIVFLVIALSSILFFTLTNSKFSQEFLSNNREDEINDETTFFELEMTDKDGNYLESRVLDWKKDEPYILNIINTDRNVYGEKIFLMFNGVQYDLNIEDEYKKTLTSTKNDHNESSFKITLPELPEGNNYGSLICENQYIEAPELLSPETEIRFLVKKKSDSLNSMAFETPTTNIAIKVNKTENHLIENKINSSIDFAVFHEFQLENVKIIQNNMVKHQSKTETCHYAYIHNSTASTCEYAIYLILDDDIIGTSLNSDNITISSNEDAIYKINVPSDLIPVGTEYYFMLTPNPNINLEDNGIKNAWNQGINTESSFSQRYIIIE
jgi:hypothetical protein